LWRAFIIKQRDEDGDNQRTQTCSAQGAKQSLFLTMRACFASEMKMRISMIPKPVAAGRCSPCVESGFCCLWLPSTRSVARVVKGAGEWKGDGSEGRINGVQETLTL
jgi:hypothetical protein